MTEDDIMPYMLDPIFWLKWWGDLWFKACDVRTYAFPTKPTPNEERKEQAKTVSNDSRIVRMLRSV